MTSFTTPPNLTNAQAVKGDETGSIAANSSLAVTTGPAITWDLATVPTGTGIRIDNAGTISAGTGRAIDTVGTAANGDIFTLTNRSGALVTSPNDTFRVNANLPGGSVTIDNSGTLKSTTNGRVLDFGAITSTTARVTITNSPGANATDGTIQAVGNDAIRVGGGGTTVLTNGGLIDATTGAFRAVNVSEYLNVASLKITNQSTGMIQSSDDALRITTATAATVGTGTVLVDNFGTIRATGSGQAIDFNDVNSSAGKVVIRNEAAGTIVAANNDGIRPGQNGIVENYGQITANAAVPGGQPSADGVDFQDNHTGSVHNFATGVISGARHGITAGLNANVTVTNEAGGQITGRDGSGVGSDGAGTVTNLGTITGTIDRTSARGDGDGVDVDNAATIVNFGTIQGLGAKGADSGGRANAGEGISIGGGSVENHGLIRASATTLDGIVTSSTGGAIVVNNDANLSRSGVAATTIKNFAGGVISSDSGFAIRLENKDSDATDADTITNYGTITGGGTIPDPTAVVTYVNPTSGATQADPNSVGTLDGVTYTGTGSARFIRGDGSAIQMGEGNDVLTNYGVVNGAATTRAINLEGGNDTLNLYSGSSITGQLNGGAGNDVLNLRLDDRTGASTNTGPNSGVTAGTLAKTVNFETLNVEGGNWTISDAQAYASGIAIANNATLTIGPAGVLSGAIAITGTLAVNHSDLLTLGNALSGTGILQQIGSGGLKLSGANTYSGGTALAAGTLELGQLTSAGTGAITFAADAQKLQIDVTGTLTNTLTTIGTGDQIDFQALTFTGAQRVYDATNHTLTVTNGVQSNTVRLDGGTTLTNSQFVLSADADGSAIVTIGGGMAPAAPTGTGSVPSTGNAMTFDGTRDVTAAKGDILVLSVDPQNFTGGAEQNGNVVLSATNGTTATIANAVLNSDGLPNVFVPQGDFLVGKAGFSITSTKANSILLGVAGSEITDIVDPSLAAGSHFIAGGVGRVDPNDGADAITIGGKGKWAVFANAGNDTVNQDGATTSAFDAASVVNLLGQNGNDQITLANVANKASIFASGGAGADTIAVVNAGATTIYGGDDSTDAADRITFNGVNGAGGTSLIFGNGGDDTITVGNTTALDSTSTSTVYGGFGNDQITVVGTKATLSIIGGEGSDTITVANTGTTFITGGNQSGDQSLDGADNITVNGSGGTIAIFSNLGNDTVSATGLLDGTSIQIYGGRGNDTITEGNLTTTGKNTIFIAGGEDADTITATGNGGALTIYGGISSADSADGSDSITIGDGSTGALNVFANGGNDTVSIGALGTDTTNTATVYGGGGADSIIIAGQASGQQALTVFGNEGPDAFSIAKGTGQTVTIADFKASEGDSLKLTGLGGTPGNLQVVGGNYDILQRALDAAANAANGASGASKAAAVVFAGSTYVVIDSNAGAGFQATDQAIKLTGVTELSGLIGATTLVA